MRHFIKKNRWRAFYYSGFTLPSSKHKTMDEFFSDNELKKFKPKIWRLFWDTLVSNNILTLSPPSNDTLEEISYGDKVTSSANVTYIFELIKKDCKRSYRFSMETMSREIFKDLPQFKTVKTLIDLMNRRLTLENSKKD